MPTQAPSSSSRRRVSRSGDPPSLPPAVGSITQVIRGFRNGNDDAARLLWDRYFARAVRLAKQRLRRLAPTAYDEEDVALSAFMSVFDDVRRKEASVDYDRDDFWTLTATITLRKTFRAIRDGNRRKRNPHQDGARIVPLSDAEVVEALLSREPEPAETAQFAEQFQHLLQTLDKTELQQIVLSKLNGYTNVEIAAQLGRGVSSIERKLKTIRELWQASFTVEEDSSGRTRP